MIENTAITCTFGVRPRGHRDQPVNLFGSPEAIGPHLAGLHPAEARAAIAMMEERGHGLDEMARACGLTPAELGRIARKATDPVRAPGAIDDVRTEGDSYRAAPVQVRHLAPVDIDRALKLVAAHAAGQGARLDDRFVITLDTFASLLHMATSPARARLHALIAARLIDWHRPPGQPGTMLITAEGRLRLERMGVDLAELARLEPFRAEDSLPQAWSAQRARQAKARARSAANASDIKARRMLGVLERLRLEAGAGPQAGFPASVSAVMAASGIINKTARNHLDSVIARGWVARDASAGRCATLTITQAGRAVLDAMQAGEEK